MTQRAVTLEESRESSGGEGNREGPISACSQDFVLDKARFSGIYFVPNTGQKGGAVAQEMIRTHVVLPRDLVEAIDQLVGERKRSEFVTEALRERVARERLGSALATSGGILSLSDHPEWETAEKVSAWVRELRATDNATTERKLRRPAR